MKVTRKSVYSLAKLPDEELVKLFQDNRKTLNFCRLSKYASEEYDKAEAAKKSEATLQSLANVLSLASSFCMLENKKWKGAIEADVGHGIVLTN